MQKRPPRFRRADAIGSIQVTERDRAIMQLVHRHRFLRSRHITALVDGSEQRIIRRLRVLFHHGYLERPRAQLTYYDSPGSRPIVYGLGNKGGASLRREFGITVAADAWNEKNNSIGRVFLDHTLLVSDIMVALELACRERGFRLLYEDELDLPVTKRPFQWWVKIPGGTKLTVVPDRVFALEYIDATGKPERAYFFLEADRGTMPVVRKNPAQTSFRRKLLAYAATWTNKVHQRYLSIHHFRVLTVTTIPGRVQSLLQACSQLPRGHGLFLFADASVLEKDLFSSVWQNGKASEQVGII